MGNTSSNKLSNEEYEALISKTFEGTLVKEKTIVKGKVVSIENDLVTIDVGWLEDDRPDFIWRCKLRDDWDRDRKSVV